MSQLENSLVYKMNCHKDIPKQQALDVLNISCTIQTALSINNCTAPRCDRQTYTVDAVLTKIDTRVDSTGKVLETLKLRLIASRVATGKYLYLSKQISKNFLCK